MNRLFSLVSDEYPDVILCAIQWGDQENLRNWKNDNRYSFFYQELITPAAQQEWFEAYLRRDEDFMFLIRSGSLSIGCIGFRLCETNWDIYNVILGTTAFSGRGYMRQAIRMICSYARTLQALPITAKVLITNPALRWYYRNGFRERAVHADYVDIELYAARFTPCILKEVARTETVGK
jgi:RimJ/RimL family protein N-acetyltransferase